MISLVTVAYNQARATEKLVKTFLDYGARVHLFMHSRRPEVVRMCQQLGMIKKVRTYEYGNNPGLAKSWNEGIFDSQGKHVFIVNNDIEIEHKHIDEMIRIAELLPDKYMISAGAGFSCFILQPIAIKTIGYFDEAIKPAYYEDVDYAYRAGLAGLHSIDLPDLGVKHVNNGTLKNERKSYKKKYRHDMARLRHYIRAKWGGGPLMEPDTRQFDYPFDDSRVPLYLPPFNDGYYQRFDYVIR